MQFGDISNLADFNPMANFKSDSSNLLGSNKVLQGHISVEMPKFEHITDEQLKEDLKALSIDGVKSSEATPDKLYKSFSSALSDGLQNVNNLQKESEDLTQFFASGGNVDIHSVMIASQKAGLGLEMATQLRNKIVGAYKEITRMQF
ncbi:MAG: flagellar hook-basal body complex protein FliE [Candidatus Gastranaerophilales bacterium]|nr:flagellar hook-basal body complex protein FliE [Candidatus Gastranaerophilales bacterium]